MVRLSKWIKGAKPEKPVTEVARRSICARLASVWHYAPRAAKTRQDEDIELVHQLRVSVRRANAALQVYADLLPRRKVKSMKKRLRALRKAAGDARDLDVLADRMATASDRKRVLEEIGAQRDIAQKPLVRSYLKAKQKRFARQSRKLLRQIRWRDEGPEPAFGEYARAKFRPLVDEFFAAANADLSDVKALHQLRISGKQVRYAMELLASAFDDSFRKELYPVFGEVQEKLGKINDHVTAITLFHKWIKRSAETKCRRELRRLIADEEERLEEESREFRSWWTADRAAALAEQFNTAMLGQQTRRDSEPSLRVCPESKPDSSVA